MEDTGRLPTYDEAVLSSIYTIPVPSSAATDLAGAAASAPPVPQPMPPHDDTSSQSYTQSTAHQPLWSRMTNFLGKQMCDKNNKQKESNSKLFRFNKSKIIKSSQTMDSISSATVLMS